MIDPVDALALQVLTDKQFDVWNRHRRGASIRTIALQLGLARTTIVDRYDAACLRLHRAGVRFTPDGRPYLEEQTPA